MAFTPELQRELHRAIEFRKQKLKELNLAINDLEVARNRLRRSKEAKAVRNAKAVEKMMRGQYDRACDSLRSVEDEVLSGLTGLPLIDAARPPDNGTPRVGADGDRPALAVVPSTDRSATR